MSKYIIDHGQIYAPHPTGGVAALSLEEIVEALEERDQLRGTMEAWEAGDIIRHVRADGQVCIMHGMNGDPNAEVRDSETGEVIFPAKRAPLRLVETGAAK